MPIIIRRCSTAWPGNSNSVDRAICCCLHVHAVHSHTRGNKLLQEERMYLQDHSVDVGDITHVEDLIPPWPDVKTWFSMRIAQDAPARHPFTSRKACARRWRKMERGEKSRKKKGGGGKRRLLEFHFCGKQVDGDDPIWRRKSFKEACRRSFFESAVAVAVAVALFFSFSLLPRNTLLLGYVQAQDGSTSGNGWV